MKDDLIRIGLNEQEALVYLQLLKEKNQTASDIAIETKTNRSVVYSILEKLIEKGLVNFVLINGVKRFSTRGANALSEFVAMKERTLRELLPKLRSLNQESAEKTEVEVFQGINGSFAVMKDIINTGENYLAFGEDSSFQNIFGTLAEQYIRQLKEKKICERLLVPKGNKVLASRYSKVRYLPETIKLPAITAIYGDKVAIAIFQKPYYAIVIKSKDLAESYKSLFEYLWTIAKS